jgi:hypothetical protein
MEEEDSLQGEKQQLEQQQLEQALLLAHAPHCMTAQLQMVLR